MDDNEAGNECGAEASNGNQKDRPVQWHEGFMCALELEFKDNWDNMQFIRNHTLNTKPLEIDMLIIELEKGIDIKDEIGEFFRTYNIVEYKSDYDELNFDTFVKAQAYACLYKCEEAHLDERPYEEGTVTIIRRSRPRALFKYLREHGFQVTEMHHGVYRVDGKMLFPTQIIVGNELDVGRHKILDIISDKASKQAIRDAFIYKESVTDKRELDLYDSVLDLCMRLNEKPIEELKEEDQKMNQALMRIMEPELREATQRVERETAQRVERETAQRVERETAQRVERETAQRVERETKAADMKLLIKNMRRFHAGDDDILETLKEDYGLSEEEALSYL